MSTVRNNWIKNLFAGFVYVLIQSTLELVSPQIHKYEDTCKTLGSLPNHVPIL